MYKTNRNKFIEFRKTKKWLLIIYLVSLLVWLFLFLFCYFFQNFKFQIPTEQYLFQIVSAAICGLCLPFSGSSLQYLTRNELAGPTTLGFLPLTTTSLIIYLFIDKASQDGIGVYFQYIITFVLSILLIAIIYFITKKTKNKMFLILMGLMIGILIGAINSLLIYLFPSFSISYSSILGNMQILFDWTRFYISIPIMVIGMILVLFVGKKINIISNNEEIASSLGINTKQIFWIGAISSILITIGATLLIGSIIGIAIVFPIVAKKFLGNNNFYINSSISSLWTSSLLVLSIMLNYQYLLGINFFCMFIVIPLFLSIIMKRKF